MPLCEECHKLTVERLITDPSDLEGTVYYEFQPGSYSGQHWKMGSVFVSDDAFDELEPVLSLHITHLDPLGPNIVETGTWALMAQDLRRVVSLNQVTEGFVDLFLDLAAWLEWASAQHETVSLLGI